jgi:hypothetical protein
MEARSRREKEEIFALRESFNELGRLQQECNDELSAFQRENFLAHEEFRSISAHLLEKMNEFQTKINFELDRLSLRINYLEILAMHSFPIRARRLMSCPGGRYMTCVNHRIIIALVNGDIRTYDLDTQELVSETTVGAYDPLSGLGKVTQFYAGSRVYIGFATGLILSFEIDSLATFAELNYHKDPITAFCQCEEYVASGCQNGLIVMWHAQTLQRLMIITAHHSPIVGIGNNGKEWIICDKTGTNTIHNQLFTEEVNKFALVPSISFICPKGETGLVTVSDQLFVWEGKVVLKTFDAVTIEANPVCALKVPELLLLGSQRGPKLKLIFLDSLLFPKTVDVLDAPPLSIVHFDSHFYVLTTTGNICVIEASA